MVSKGEIMSNIIETVGESVYAPEVASLARAKLEKLVSDGAARTGPIIERIMSEVPNDSIVRADKLGFRVNAEAAVRMGVVGSGSAGWSLHRNALGQLADRAGVPLRYLDALLENGDENGWKRELAQKILTDHYAHDGSRYLVRDIGGEARAVLSDRFRRLDSRPLLDAFVSAAGKLGAVPFEGMGSDVRCYVRAIVPTVYEPVPGEAMVFGLDWSNSDFGRGTYQISAFVLRLICLNGMTGANHTRQVHLGGRLSDTIEFSAETYRRDTRTMLSATRDVIAGALGPKAIETQLSAVRQAHASETNWSAAFRKVSKALTKAEAESVKDAFEGPDVINLPAGKTEWRFSNALSWVANRADDADRKAELQALAGDVIAA
jgi:hypothetical protein